MTATPLVIDLVPGAGSSAPSQFYAGPDGRLYFIAKTPATGSKSHWFATDGTLRGTVPVDKSTPGVEPRPQVYKPYDVVHDGKYTIFHSSVKGLTGLWTTDGTSNGTRRLSASIDPFAVNRGKIY